MIENRNITPGTRLVARYHKQTFTCEVVEGEEGKLRYRLADGREFKSPSAAGMAITGKACNGWAFWSVEAALDTKGSETPAETLTPLGNTRQEQEVDMACAPTEPEQSTGKKPIFRLPNQKGVPEGQTRWYCRDCAQSFLAPLGETPKTCPAGHHAG